MRQTKRFGTEDFKNGISVSRTNLDTEFKLSENSVNLTFGNYEGIGPRYGISPIPGQGPLNVAVGNAYNRFGVTSNAKAISPLAFLNLNIAKFDDYKTKQNVFCFVSVSTLNGDVFIAPNTANLFVDFNFCITTELVATSPGVFQRADGTAGNVTLSQPRNYIDTGVDWTDPESTRPYGFTEYRRLPSFLRRFSVAYFNVSGREYQQPYMLTKNIGTDSATNPGVLSWHRMGEWQECATGPRILGAQRYNFFTLQNSSTSSVGWCAKRSYVDSGVALTAASYVWSRSIQTVTNNFTPGNSFSGGLNTGTFTGNAPHVLYYNPNNRISSAFTWFGVACGKAVIGYLKDDQKTAIGSAVVANGLGAGEGPQSMVQYIDLNDLPFFKESKGTFNESGGSFYSEDGERKATVFWKWPPFVTGVAPANDSASPITAIDQNIRLGDANSGVLRANTIYEITYSVFNKALNFETNVGVPAKIQTGTNDFVRLSIYRAYRVAAGDRPIPLRYNPVNTILGGNVVINADNNIFHNHTNHLSLRFYYRALGTYEWLPTTEIDVCDFFFNSERPKVWICEDPVARAPGGQPGGFSDYSPIPKSDYHTVLQYQGRAFWVSNNLFCFSMRNNPFAYPIRNQGTCPKGRFLGAIEHAYPGQAVQDARLVIFGSEETYAARFIPGGEQQEFVRVGPFDGGTFPVEGTNFRIGVWTSVTAFSGRAAAVAKGVLYFWGPQGVYMDDGRDLPVKISGDLEPWLNGIFDKSEQENIFAIFNDDTEDLIWFFKPPASDQNATPSQALVLNVRTMAFNRWTFKSLIIHSAQRVECNFNRTNNKNMNGSRIMIFAQEVGSASNFTVPLFFDANTNGGDHSPNKQYIVNQVTTSGLNRNLIVTPDPAAEFSGGGTRVLSIVGYERYADKAEGAGVDGIYSCQYTGANQVTIFPTAGVNFPTSETLADNLAFPVYFAGGTTSAITAGSNSIDLTMQSQYWAPGGIYNWWLYLYTHFLFRVKLLKEESSNKVTVAYQGMLDNGSAVSNVLTLTDNSRENCQILNSVAPLQNQVSGQGMRMTMTCVHIGGLWSLQYLGIDVVPQPIDELKTFEG
jgi:hypothetical protein